MVCLRRLNIIPFDQNLEVHPEKKIKNVEKKIRKEYEGIIYKAICAYREVLRKGKFSKVKESDQKIMDMLKSSSTIAAWISDHVEADMGGKPIPTTEAFKLYKEWCGDNGLRPKLLRKAFTIELKRQLRMAGIVFIYSRPRISGEKTYSFLGIKIG